jgi:hypothetical protein
MQERGSLRASTLQRARVGCGKTCARMCACRACGLGVASGTELRTCALLVQSDDERRARQGSGERRGARNPVAVSK